MMTDELVEVLEKFDGVYCYLCQDYDTENQWEEREVDAFDHTLVSCDNGQLTDSPSAALTVTSCSDSM